MRAALPLALLLASLLAGCSGGDGGQTVTFSTMPDVAREPELRPPVWSVGDWWNYTSSDGGSFTYVVASAGGDDYGMATDSAQLAFFDARTDVSTLGAIRKSDLAGSQGDVRVEFLQWPLRDGLRWNTTWDGVAVAIAAHRVGPDAFRMEARRPDGTLHVSYAYDNRTRWFTELAFTDAAGNVDFSASLQAKGTGYQGTLASWRLDEVLDAQLNNAPVAQGGDFNVPAGATDVYLERSFACAGGGRYSVLVGPLGPDAAQAGVLDQGECPSPLAVTTLPAVAGAWGYQIQVLAVPPALPAARIVLLVRTLERTPLA